MTSPTAFRVPPSAHPKPGPKTVRLITVSDDAAFAARIEHAFADIANETYRVHPGGDRTMLRARAGPGTFLLIDRRHVTRKELWAELARIAASGSTGLVVDTIEAWDPLAPHSTDWAELRHDLPWDSSALLEAIRRTHDGSGWSGEVTVGASREVGSAAEKAHVLAELRRRLEDLAVTSIRRGHAIAVLEELLMNALYDAYAATADQRRDPAYSLAPDRRVRAQWTISADVVRFCVSDWAGTLDPAILRDILRGAKGAGGPTVDVTRTAGRGGGVGLYLVLRNSRRFAAFVEPGRLTEVSVDVGLTPRGEESPRETMTYFGRK